MVEFIVPDIGDDVAPSPGTLQFDTNINGSGEVVVNAESPRGTLILAGDNSYTGGTEVESGVLQGDTDSLQGDIGTANDTEVVFVQDFDGTYAGIMSGDGRLTKQGGGTLILTGDNLYEGGTTVTAGTLSVSEDNNLGGPTGALSLDGGILRITESTFASTPRPISLDGGSFDVVIADHTFTLAQDIVPAGDENGGLTKLGEGTLELAGNNSYFFGTNLFGGVLSVSADENLGVASGRLTFDGGILRVSGTSFKSTDRPIDWGTAGGGFDISDPLNNFTVSQQIIGPGPLTKLGAGTLEPDWC